MNRFSSSFKAEEFTEVFIGSDDEFELIDIVDEGRSFYHRRITGDYVNTTQLSLEQPSQLGRLENDRRYLKRDFVPHSDSSKAVEVDFFRGAAPPPSTKNLADANQQTLVVNARELGLVAASFFGGLLALSAVFNEVLIAPLIGWSGVLFGVGFALMTRAPSVITDESCS